MFHYFDPLYLALLLPTMILAGLASLMTKTTFSRYSRVRASSGLTGAQAARRLLVLEGLQEVAVEQVQGFLSDHYDPVSRTLRLSAAVYASPSLSAIGVACHEAGHAIQHSHHYAPLALRSALVPVTQIGSYAPYLLFALGMLFQKPGLFAIGVALFGFVVLFSLVTLPVEWDASSRAKRLMVSAGIVTPAEQEHAGAVLNAAFLTYLAAAFTALMTLLYYLIRLGLIGGRDD